MMIDVGLKFADEPWNCQDQSLGLWRRGSCHLCCYVVLW